MLELKDFKVFDTKQTFYRAVIEDNNDPKKMGRVRVRILGLHSELLANVPVDTLPWAEVTTSNMLGLNTGIGVSSIPLNGTWCWVFLENNDYNRPVIFALSNGISTDLSEQETFKDPKGVYPLKDRLDEPDINRLSRVEKLDKTIVKLIEDNLDTSGEFSAGDGIEPKPLNSKSVYPNNTVIESATGHIIEIDDTPGNERLKLIHKSGSYIEIRPDGSVVTKVTKNKHETTTQNVYEHIIKSLEEIIEENKYTHIKRNHKYEVDGNETTQIKGNRTENVKGSETVTISGAGKLTYSGGLTINGGSSIKLSAGSISLN